jgi:hypothetical protein
MADLLPALRAHLVAQDIVREPRVGGTAAPLWLEPRRGTRAPGEGAGVEAGDPVAAAYLSGGIPTAFGEGQTRRDTVDFQLRTSKAPMAKALEERLSLELAPFPYGARFAWDMAGLFVLESRMWRALQPLGADEQGFTFVVSFLFETYRA